MNSRGRFLTALLLPILFLAGCARAKIIPVSQQKPVAVTKEVNPRQPVFIEPPLVEIPLGEELEYSIDWWGIPVGTAILTSEPVSSKEVSTLDPPEMREKEKLAKVTLRAFSNQYLQAFYPVRAELVTFFDCVSHSPYRFEAFVKRRFRKHKSVITFDRTKGSAFHQLPKGKSTTVPIHPETQDGLSLIAYARTLDLQVGQAVPLEIAADGRNWHLDGRIEKAEILKLRKMGFWPTFEGKVELAYPVPFFQGARARIWFSADGQRIPLLAKIQSRIGPVTVVLVRRNNPPNKKMTALKLPPSFFALRGMAVVERLE